MNEQLQQKILINISKDTDNGCWNWNGQISNSGYGKLMIKDEKIGTRMMSAQTVSYLAFIGELADGSLVKQSCNNRLCVNPEHLTTFKP